jgi:WD40 repeat protein
VESKKMIFESQIDAQGVNCFFSGEKPIFAFGDGQVFAEETQLIHLEDGIYSAALCPLSFGLIALGDDGKITRVRLNGKTEEIYHFKGDFADSIKVSPTSKYLAVALSRKVAVINLIDNQIALEFTPPMSPNYVAFDQKGENLVVGHGKGMTIYDLKTDETPLDFPVPGGVYACEFSPNLQFIVAATGEPAMVGWRLTDGVAFRMAGYPTKPNSLAWVEDGAALVTSGGPVGVLWSFYTYEGPMGQAAKTFRTRSALVTAVASNKHMIALGYNDGGVDLVEVGDNTPHFIAGTTPEEKQEVNPRIGDARIVEVAFSQNARLLAYISEDGKFGLKKLF